MKAIVNHIKGLHFEGEGSSKLRVQMDSSVTSGGSGYGASPMELVLMAVAGCSGMDVVSILEKKQVAYERFQIAVNGERSESHPRIFTDIEVIYRFWGRDLPEDTIRKALELSMTKYCSVANMLDKASNLTYQLEINPDKNH